MPAGVDDPGGVPDVSVRAFRIACARSDARTLAALFSPDVTLIVDSGGLVDAPLRPVVGAAAVVPLVVDKLGAHQELRAVEQSVNGQTAVVFRRREQAVAIACLYQADGRIETVWLVLNPDKLRHWNRAR